MNTLFAIGTTSFPAALIGSFALSAVFCWFIVRHAGLFLNDHHMLSDTQAQQALHSTPTPRVGGAAVVMAFALFLALHHDTLAQDLAFALLAVVVVFVVGLKEDVFRDVSPKARLIAAFASGGLAIALTGAMVTGLGIPEIDWLFGFVAVAVIVTLLWSAGTCHSLNLIDGLNGLSSGYAVVALTALSLIAGKTGSFDIQYTAIVLIGALLGFLIFNWPKGRIFMGDAGAYALGHILAWLGILLMARSADVSAFAILLILFWPVADTLFSIIRRKALRKSVDSPDRQHFHHIAMRVLRQVTRNQYPQNKLNPMATLVMLPLLGAPAFSGVLFWDQPAKALIALLAFSFLFVLSYGLAIDFLTTKRSSRRRPVAQLLATQAEPLPETSPLSGVFVQEALAVTVQITKVRETDYWKLRVETENATDRVWDRMFPSDHDAWMTFLEAVRVEGMETIAGLRHAPNLQH